MRSSETIAKLSADFVKAQAELKNVVFDKVNPHFKSKYATLSAVRDTVVPVLAKHNLAVIQGAAFEAGASYVTTRLVHSSGEWIESAYPFQVDQPQKMGSAMTYARRYCLAAICGIASEEDDDANAAQPEKPANNTLPPTHPNLVKNSMADKDALCKEIDDIQSMAVLTRWKADNAARIEGLSEQHFFTVSDAYKTKKRELETRAAA